MLAGNRAGQMNCWTVLEETTTTANPASRRGVCVCACLCQSLSSPCPSPAPTPSRCRNLAEEVQSLREEGARRGGEGKEREREVETLRTQLHQASKVSPCNQ